MIQKVNLLFTIACLVILILPLFAGATGQIKLFGETPVYYEEPNPAYIEYKTIERPQPKLLGHYKLTGYCSCEKCCGKSDGITATGTFAKQGRTIAVDSSQIPYGTEVIIGDNTYVAEDCGGAIKGNKIDIYFDNHKEALAFGVQYSDVYVKE